MQWSHRTRAKPCSRSPQSRNLFTTSGMIGRREGDLECGEPVTGGCNRGKQWAVGSEQSTASGSTRTYPATNSFPDSRGAFSGTLPRTSVQARNIRRNTPTGIASFIPIPPHCISTESCWTTLPKPKSSKIKKPRQPKKAPPEAAHTLFSAPLSQWTGFPFQPGQV